MADLGGPDVRERGRTIVGRGSLKKVAFLIVIRGKCFSLAASELNFSTAAASRLPWTHSITAILSVIRLVLAFERYRKARADRPTPNLPLVIASGAGRSLDYTGFKRSEKERGRGWGYAPRRPHRAALVTGHWRDFHRILLAHSIRPSNTKMPDYRVRRRHLGRTSQTTC